MHAFDRRKVAEEGPGCGRGDRVGPQGVTRAEGPISVAVVRSRRAQGRQPTPAKFSGAGRADAGCETLSCHPLSLCLRACHVCSHPWSSVHARKKKNARKTPPSTHSLTSCLFRAAAVCIARTPPTSRRSTGRTHSSTGPQRPSSPTRMQHRARLITTRRKHTTRQRHPAPETAILTRRPLLRGAPRRHRHFSAGPASSGPQIYSRHPPTSALYARALQF